MAHETASAIATALGARFHGLYLRYQDEKGMEPIQQYADFSKRLMESQTQATFVKFSARPFAITYKVGEATYRMAATSRNVRLEIIGEGA